MLKLGLLHETGTISFGFWVVYSDHWEKSLQCNLGQIPNIVQPYFTFLICLYEFLKLICIFFLKPGQKTDRYLVMFEAGGADCWK
jgi:hypothetical protein